MQTILTPSAEHLAIDGVALERHPDNSVRAFPDGEVYVQLEDVDSMEEALVVHAGMPEPNRGLAYLTGILELLKQHDVATDVCFTYIPYGMQDETFYEGGLNYARSLLNRLQAYYDVRTIYGIDAHFSHRDWTGEYTFRNVHAFPRIVEHVEMEDFVVVGPDAGARKRFGIDSFSKQRENAYTVRVDGAIDGVEGEDVLVFDDIVETGGTMAETYDHLEEQGAERIEAAVVHGVLEEGVERVESTYDDLHLTNTIRNDAASVDVEPLIRDLPR